MDHSATKLDLKPDSVSYPKADTLPMGAASKTSKSLDMDVADLGRPDTMRYNVLTMVINEDYDRAIKTLKEFLEGGSEYPNFRLRVERYITHSIDLIYAIRTKRNFPGINSLTRTKQQELKDRFREHFKELKFMMHKVEDCMEELRLTDVRSTSMVVRSFWLALVVIFVAGVGLDFMQGLGHTIEIVSSDYIDKVFTFFVDKFF